MAEPFETYALFKNTDDSILLLNKVIRPYNFEFQKVKLKRLQDEFGEIFSFDNKKDDSEELDYNGEIVKANFFKLFTRSSFLTTQKFDIKDPYYIIFLKDLEKDDWRIIKGRLKMSLKSLARTKEFANDLLQILRLYKAGNIDLNGLITISKKDRHIAIGTLQATPNLAFSRTYHISNKDVDQINLMLKEKPIINKISELAFQNFELSYRIIDPRIRFTTLMTALECLFNLGKEQISHTISRHLSLLVSNDQNTFQENYIKIKKLYKLRSEIIHGSFTKRPENELYELEDYVRKALNYTIKTELTKEGLFRQLNQMGYIT
jgi:hypothetical protein